MKYWYHQTAQGTIYIVHANNEYDIMFKGNCVGTYDDPQQAVDDLVNGHAIWSAFGDPSTLDIPEAIGEWKQG